MNMFKTDLKRAIISRTMLGAIVLGLTSIFLGILIEPLRSAIKLYYSNSTDITFENRMNLIGNSFNKVTLWHFGNNFYTILMPLVACIPFTISYLKDKKSGFNKYVIIRGNYKSYIVSKFVTTFISGFVAIFVASIISYLVIMLVDSGEQFRSIFYPDTFLSDLSKANFNLFAFIFVMICSFMGGVYATVGLAISSLIDNTLVALLSPFTIYYLGTYIIVNISVPIFSPQIVNHFYSYEKIGGQYIIIQLLVLLIVSTLIFLSKTYWSDRFE